MSTELAGEIAGDAEAGVHALLKRWDDWGERGTWRRAVAKFQAEDDTQHLAVALKALADVPPVTALDALAANARLVRLMTGWQWLAMRDARKDGATWEQIGDALGVTSHAAQQAYKRAIEAQERYCAKYLQPGEAQQLRALLNDGTEPGTARNPTYRRVDGSDLAEGMTVKDGRRLYTITGWAEPCTSGRVALVSNGKREADGQLIIFAGASYQVRND